MGLERWQRPCPLVIGALALGVGVDVIEVTNRRPTPGGAAVLAIRN